MGAESGWSVTLTGRLLARAVADEAWGKVATMLGRDVAALRARLPVTFKPGGEAQVRHQCDELRACGVEAVTLRDDGDTRLWVQPDGVTCGPVSVAYARDALARGRWRADVPACWHGQDQWQALDRLPGVATAGEWEPESEAAPTRHTAMPATEVSRRTLLWVLVGVCVVLALPLIAMLVAVLR